jgi:hypothetical protein
MRIGNYLRSRLLAVSVGATLLAGGCATVDTSKDWVDIKDPNELRALYSNKTQKGYFTFDTPVSWVLHSRADGNGTILYEGRSRPMTWEVKADDQVCLKWPGGSPCLRLQRHATRKGVYRAFNLATKSYGNEITVEDMKI